MPVTELDWGSFYRKYREHAGRPGARATVAAHASAEAPYEVILTYSEQGTQWRGVYHIGSRHWVMVEGEVYEGQTRVDHIVFREIKLNTGVRDRWFRL